MSFGKCFYLMNLYSIHAVLLLFIPPELVIIQANMKSVRCFGAVFDAHL